jgi:hypothetical protein
MTDAGDAAVTEEFTDPLFREPYIEVNEHRALPEPHRYVHGGFRDTAARFSFYFPDASRYQGRFHHNTYPLAASADIGPFPIAFEVATGNLGFSFASGAYYVQTNNGGAFRQGDPTVAAYRANAAAARFSRTVAERIYGPHRPYGYLYGGSGGAYQTVGASEHTQGVWDGFMPFVLGCNNAVPSFWAVRLHALRILRKRNRFPAVMDAIDPGGRADMYAPLNDEERAALKEADLMGYPSRGWYNHDGLHDGYFSDVYGVIPALDPTYAADFWSKPGYLGADAPALIAADRFEFETTIAGVLLDQPKRVILASVPAAGMTGSHLTLLSGASAGSWLPIASADESSVSFASTSDAAIVAGLRVGDRVRIDNSWLLAAQTYQRHQVPPDRAEYGWNQFRDPAGKPLYPQRDILIGHFFALNSVGSLLSGRIHGRMLLVQALMDIDALPWSADWYRSEVRRSLGIAAGDRFALWFIDHAQHDDPATDTARAHTVSLAGVLQQGLRDLARWVETGARPSDTGYSMKQSQVEVPLTAGERQGIQAVIDLRVNGGVRAEASVNERVSFSAIVEVPAGAGMVVEVNWDFEGLGKFAATTIFASPQSLTRVTNSHAYEKAGTYFPVLRVVSQREGDSQTPYARVQNIARVRVVVE